MLDIVHTSDKMIACIGARRESINVSAKMGLLAACSSAIHDRKPIIKLLRRLHRIGWMQDLMCRLWRRAAVNRARG
jgi:hypothetical protein